MEGGLKDRAVTWILDSELWVLFLARSPGSGC